MKLQTTVIGVITAGALLHFPPAPAADRRSATEFEAQYQVHRAKCLSGHLNQDRATGIVRGSVDGGGFYNELRVLVPQ